MRKLVSFVCALVGGALAAPPAHAFCGFYVSGSDARLFNNATLAAMMREGTRTVLAMPSEYNNFQARYVIRHRWTGPVACKDPHFGEWGGPPPGTERPPQAATSLAFAERGVKLAAYVVKEVPELGVKPQPHVGEAVGGVATWWEDQKVDKTKKRDEYGGRPCGVSGTWQGSVWMVLAMLGLLVRRRA